MSAEKHTILYIEDDPNSRRLVERTLAFAGYAVSVAACGLEGIDMARQIKPDLILTDINLPDLSGQEIATTLRGDDHCKSIPIVALTAQGRGTKDWEMAFAAGINGYITKPIDIEQLPAQVAFYLNGGSDHIPPEQLAQAQARYTQEIVLHLEKRIRELEKFNRELTKLDRMKDTFIEITAHELRTPLTLVYGYSRLLEDYPPLRQLMQYDPQVAELMYGMTEAISRMQSIIGEIITVARIMTEHIDLSISPVNMQRLLERAIRSFDDALAERRLTLSAKPEQFPTALRGDGDLLYMVLVNLLSNAIKYTPDGGTITITAIHDAEQLRFNVRDTGIGIDRGERTRIFERFHTTSDASLHSTSKTAFGGGGIGLGLTICKGIVEAHGGQIWVESDRRDPQACPGSTFYVTLPMNPQVQRRVKQV